MIKITFSREMVEEFLQTGKEVRSFFIARGLPEGAKLATCEINNDGDLVLGFIREEEMALEISELPR